MVKKSYNVVGVMSGTSLDGIDLAHLHFTENSGKWTFEIHQTATVSYDAVWFEKLKNAVSFSEVELKQLDRDYTKLLGKTIFDFIKKNNIQNLDAVCSHGHTILHQPQNGLTLQIGNLPELATICKQKVVCDFRVQDVKLGGQGAPLVPIGDKLLFSEYDYCLNLGGFSNISFDENGARIAFDISPVNTVLNFYANQLGLDFDNRGIIARSGKFNLELFKKLNALEFYSKKYPKSLGFEFVKDIILPLLEEFSITIEDKMHTFTEHIAFQISEVLFKKNGSILITGGGAYNDFLMERLRFYLPKMKIEIPNATILEFKEALIFGLLGVLKLRNEINVLCSVTGAAHDHSSGIVYDF